MTPEPGPRPQPALLIRAVGCLAYPAALGIVIILVLFIKSLV